MAERKAETRQPRESLPNDSSQLEKETDLERGPSSDLERENDKLELTSSNGTDSPHVSSPRVESNIVLDPNNPPDGGLEAWLVVAGGFFAIFCSFGWINCIGVFQDYYQYHQLSSYSSSTVSWIPSTESFMMFFWGPIAGKFVDDFGPRWPILMGSLLHIFGLMMLSISDKYYQIFLAQGVCSAIGCSFLFYPTIAACGSWFKRHRALAFGIMVAGSSIGGVVLPIMVQKLLPQIGFGWTMRTVAFLLLALLIFSNLTVKSRLPPTRKPMSFMDFITPFTEGPFLLLALSSFFIYIGGFLPFNFLIVQGRASGMSPELAQYLVPILNAASTFGRIIPAHIGDKFGVFNVMIVNTVFAAVITLALWLPASSSAPVIVYASLYGFASGCTLSIIPAMVATLSDVRKLGVRNGALYSFSAFGVLIGSPIAGAIVNDQKGAFSGLEIFCGIALLVGTVFAVFSRTAQVGWKLRKRI